jgi:hypothetical protein
MYINDGKVSRIDEASVTIILCLPECVFSFNMGWWILVKFTNICQPMLKLKTHSGFTNNRQPMLELRNNTNMR